MIRDYYAGIDFQRIEKISGDLQSQTITLRPIELRSAANDEYSLHYSLITENLDVPFEISEGVIIPVGEYSFGQYCLGVESAEYRQLQVEGSYCGGEFYDGTQDVLDASLVWRPSAHFKFTAGYGINDIVLPQGAFITRLASLRADIAFTNTWYWENLLQYDNVSYSLGLNSILRWVPRAGREFVFVVNREYVDFSRDNTFTTVSGDVTLKFSYMFRF